MGVIEELLKDVTLPQMVHIKQKFDGTAMKREQIPDVIRQQMSRDKIRENFHPGAQIAITVGSRGIDNIALIIKSIADVVKENGSIPFIVPTMGSHGGATAEGQRAVIESYGVTESYIGCEIRSSMETVEIGRTQKGYPVMIDKQAYEADGIILAGRIKPHTAYRGPYESGLMKMAAIGLGKQYGSEIIHRDGFKYFREYIPAFGTVILKNAPVLFGLAILENAYDKTRELVALTSDEIITEEPELLKRAKSYMPRILFAACDVLIVDEMGKNISGDGMDPNISGRFPTPYADGGINAQRVAVLDLTEETHGNACGIGLADCTTKRLFSKLILEQTYPNAITNTVVGEMKIPMMLESDELAIKAALKSCNEIDKNHPRVIRIKNTLRMEDIEISEALVEEAESNPSIEINGKLGEMVFDKNGNLF